MDEKTDALRDIFLDVAEDPTVTEPQEQGRGSLQSGPEDVSERISTVIEALVETFEVSVPLSLEQSTQVVEKFYAGAEDDTIADHLDVSPEVVFTTRMALHLVREAEKPAPGRTARIREYDDPEATDPTDTERLDTALVDGIDLDQAELERAVAIVRATNRARRVNHRFRMAFEEVLTDADLSVRLTSDAKRDGLAEATEDADVNVDF